MMADSSGGTARELAWEEEETETLREESKSQ